MSRWPSSGEVNRKGNIEKKSWTPNPYKVPQISDWLHFLLPHTSNRRLPAVNSNNLRYDTDFVEDPHKNQVTSVENPADNLQHPDSDNNTNGENPMPSPQQEEEVIKKKYGGLIPKKPPLISKDHERAYFDSADWALGKQGAQKPKGPLEALRPKLQPTTQQTRSRRSAYAPADEGEDGSSNNASLEHQSATEDVDSDNTNTSQDQCH
ncbi:hypothetical protein Ahy_B05g077233 isoform A [Arachis hypogaea]|uniref:Negatively light-regulated protein n=1 Tax=Arachis hypogaea TaxID=3818 RepID=A0A444Z4H9_ARAHY|nr:hypothetical protein Ahy_B05g077233 isoform A [Arachis hypogaea]